MSACGDKDKEIEQPNLTEGYLKIELASEYYHASKDRTVVYTINGEESYTIQKDAPISSLEIQAPTISKLDGEDYRFSYWAYKDENGKYKNIKDVIATDEIAIDGVITLYPFSVYEWIGPH